MISADKYMNDDEMGTPYMTSLHIIHNGVDQQYYERDFPGKEALSWKTLYSSSLSSSFFHHHHHDMNSSTPL